MVADGRRARQGGAPLTRPQHGDHTRPVHPRHRLARVAVLPGIALALVACAGGAAADADRDAAALVQRAERYEARGSIETRRLAMDCLERATAMAPGRPDYQLALGRVYYDMGFLKQARTRFQRAEKLDPQSADARIGIGQVWRRDWLKYLDRASLARAVENLSVASRLRPGDCQVWLELVPLLFEQE